MTAQTTAAYSNRNLRISPEVSVVDFTGSPTRLLISEPARPWRDSAISRLNKLVHLENGWDGYKGLPVSFENANFALRVLEAVCDANTREPQIIPGASGDLQIEWHLVNGDVELDVRGPNNVIAWRANSATGPDGEELLLTNDFIEVARWIKQLSENADVVGTAAA